MKKKIIGISCAAIILLVVGFFGMRYGTGHVDKAAIKAAKSDIYTQEDMEQAQAAVKKFFFTHMRGMALEELRYDESSAVPMAEEMVKDKLAEDMEDILIFQSDFSKKYPYFGNEAFSDQETGYQWTVIRDRKSGKWSVEESLCGEG